MIDSLSNKLVNYLDKGNYLDEDKEIYLHGAKLIISEVIGTLLLLVLGLMTNHFIEAVVYEIVLSSTRVMPNCLATGEAAGIAATLAIKENTDVCNISGEQVMEIIKLA